MDSDDRSVGGHQGARVHAAFRGAPNDLGERDAT